MAASCGFSVLCAAETPVAAWLIFNSRMSETMPCQAGAVRFDAGQIEQTPIAAPGRGERLRQNLNRLIGTVTVANRRGQTRNLASLVAKVHSKSLRQ